MSINNISLFGTITSSSTFLSEEIRRKLLELGINPNSVSSEAEAKAIVARAGEYKQMMQIEKTQTTKKDDYNPEHEKQNNTALYEMFNMNANINKFIHGL